jgi:hypothetical protein
VAEAVDRLAFDASAEGERLRRFQLSGQRALLRTIDSLLKLRRQEPSQQTESDAAGSLATVAGLSGTIGYDAERIPSSFVADLLPAVLDLPAAPEPEHAAPNLPNEPNTAGADPPSAPEESGAAPDDHQISPNEPSHAPCAHSASPPPDSAPLGKATDIQADPPATPTRGTPGEDTLLPASPGSHRPAPSDPRGWTNSSSRRPEWLPDSRGVTP